MNSRLVFVLGFLLAVGLATTKADELEEHDEISNDEGEEKIEMEDEETETALVENDGGVLKNKGLCQFGIGVWRKPGANFRCNCMKCDCKTGGKWACGFHFSYCPYYYCANIIYNPKTHICCCGKLWRKKANFHCCGYNYYNGFTSKCCPYFSIKAKKSYCPRSKI